MSRINVFARCQHRTPAGRQCRFRTSGASSRLCKRHSTTETQRHSTDLTATLTDGLGQFKSPAAINGFLSRLLLLLAQDRISCRRAAVLAYITNQLLHTVSAMEQAAAKSKNAPVRVSWDIPRPAHEHRDEPQCP
jgi:hypothetical protein